LSSRLFDLFLERHRESVLSAFGTPEVMAQARAQAPARTGAMRASLGVLTVGGTMSDDEMRQLRDRWREGGWSFDGPTVLPAGAEVVLLDAPEPAPDVPEPRFALLELDE
jgi:hypothetical protein